MTKSMYDHLTKQEIIDILETLRKDVSDLDAEIQSMNDKITSEGYKKDVQCVTPHWLWNLELILNGILLRSIPRG